MTVPVLVRDEAMIGTGYFPIGKEQAYAMSNDHPPTFLVGTAEVSLTAYHMNETLDERTLPRKYVALSSCFRREAGTTRSSRARASLFLFWRITRMQTALSRFHRRCVRT